MSTTRYLCPLNCGWHHDRPDPDLSDPDAAHPFIAQDWATGIDALVAGLMAGEAAVVEQALKAHLGTHALVEWVTALVEAQRQVERVRAVAAPERDLSSPQEYFDAWEDALAAVRSALGEEAPSD